MLNGSRLGAALAVFALIFAVPACSKDAAKDETPAAAAAAPGGKPAPSAAEGPAAPEAPAPPPARPVPEVLPDVLARVNGEDVNKADFDRLLKQMEMQAGRSVPAEQRNQVYRGIIDQLVTYTLLIQETKNRNVVVTDAEAREAADSRIAELRKQVPNEAAFNKALAERNMTVARLRADIRRDIAINKMMQAEMSKLQPPTDADLKDYYDKNPDEFRGVRASHILIRPEGFDDAAKQKARAAIEEVLKQAKAGADFGELAKKHSSDGSAQAGGDLGFFTKGTMVPAFSDAAFALQPGQMSDIVETQFGFHIIKVTERKDVQFAEATDKLRAFLSQKRQQDAEQAFLNDLKSRAKIEVLV
jgi:peptidyl-prolyl cis-trans isomerase C